MKKVQGRRLIALVFLLAFSLAFLTACGNGGTGSSASAEASGQSSQAADESSGENAGGNTEKRTVTLWHALNEGEMDPFTKVLDGFNASSSTATVELVYIPREELLKQLTIGNLAGDMADMAMIDNPDTAAFAATGVFEDLTDYFSTWDDGQFLEGPLNSATYEGRVYGVPYAFNCLAMFYDADMLEAAGVSVPTTWAELETAAAALTNGETYGFAFSAIKTEEATFQFVPFLTSAGGDVNQVSSDAGIKALSMLSGLVQNGYASKEVVSWTQADVEKQFATGKAAMMINGSWQVPTVAADAPDKNWGIANIPKDEKYASCLGGENICVTKGGDVEACWEFLTYLCGSDINAEYCKSVSKFSPRSDVDLDALWSDDENMKVFAENMTYAVARGPHPRWTEISNEIQVMIQEACTGGKTAEQAAKDAQVKIDEINANVK